jgi:hypothetical protein
MGYTLAIRTRSPALRKKLTLFMAANYRPWSLVFTGKDDRASNVRPPMGDDLSYDHARTAFGVDYNSSLYGWEREYAYAFVRWMALQAGRRQRRFKKDQIGTYRFSEPVPYIVYDGYESWPLILCACSREAAELPKDVRWCAVDRYGFHNGPFEKTRMAEHSWAPYDRNAFEKKVIATIGPMPENGDRFAWRKRYYKVMYPFVEQDVEKHMKPMRDEMKRLDTAWLALSR